MRREKIRFRNEEGIELAALLDRPEEEPLAYALFAHCFTCTKNFIAAADISRALRRRGIAVLRFDFTGLGESGGDFAETTFSSDVRDLVAAARFLARNYRAPEILIGHSLGGAAVVKAAADIPSAAAVVTIGAPCHPQQVARLLGESREEIERSGQATVRIAGRAFTLKKKFLEDLEAQDPRSAIRALGRALLVMHSPRDRIVAIDEAASIFQAARHPKSFISLDPADHLLTRREDSTWAAEMIAAWAGRYLPGERGAEGR